MAFFVIVTIGGSVLLAVSVSGNSNSRGFSALESGFSGPTGHYLFGTNSTRFTGWLLPSHTLLLTSFTTGGTLNHFVGATFNVFPYDVQQNSSLYLGLYVDGELSASQSYNLSDTNAHPASILQSLSSANGAQLADFSASLEGYTVTLTLNNTLPADTKITISAFVTAAVWVQIADRPSINSIEAAGTVPLPATIRSASAWQLSTTPYTPSIQVVSDEV